MPQPSVKRDVFFRESSRRAPFQVAPSDPHAVPVANKAAAPAQGHIPRALPAPDTR